MIDYFFFKKQLNRIASHLTIQYIVLGILVFATAHLEAQTAIGGTTPHGSAMLDIQSDSKGVLFPRLTSTQRDDMSAPATGLMIFNTTTGCLEINLGSEITPLWQSLICKPGTVGAISADPTTIPVSGAVLIPNQPAAGQTISIPYTGGDGGAYIGETVNSTGVSGLTATLPSGNFANGAGTVTYTISGTPANGGIASFALQIGGQSITISFKVGCGAYVAQNQWKVFACHNLGADLSADPFSPSWRLNGDYYKWGTNTKAADGPTENNSNETMPGWSYSSAVDNSWLDTDPMGNNPCPSGFRVPTREQWNAIANSQLNPGTSIGTNWTDNATNYTSGRLFGTNLYLPAAGWRDFVSGNLLERGFTGNYWASTQIISVNEVAYAIILSQSSASTTSFGRGNGLSVRCIEED